MKPTVNILGVKVHSVCIQEVLQIVNNSILHNESTTFFTPNVDFIVKAQKDKSFKKALNAADIAFPDGKPLIWAGKYLGTPLKEKVSGSSLFFKLCDQAVEKGHRFFLLGAAEGVGLKAKQNLEKKYPGIKISGVYSPPIGFEKDEKEVSNILGLLNASNANILVVGFGAPKQELFIHTYKNQYAIPVSLGLGGTIDFAAGVQKMPPECIKKSGFGWLYRLLGNPGKFIKRYLIEDMVFFKLVYNQKKRLE